MTVVCRLFASDGNPLPERGVIRLRIEDVTYQDGPSVTVGDATYDLAEAVQDAAAETRTLGGVGPLRVSADLEARRTYAVAAHVDRSGSGAVEPGDLITTMHHDAVEAAGSGGSAGTGSVDLPLFRIPASTQT